MESTLSLLLVEDEAVIQMLLDDALSEEGFALVIASNGQEALAELDAGADRFQAMVTDINFSPGPDGWKVARHARKLAPEMPIIYISGGSGHQWTTHGVPNSIMVTKPFVPAQIVTAITMLLNETDGC